MPIAAVPAYLGNDFKDASPGMRFGLLLPIWTTRQDQEADVHKRAEARSREGQEVAAMLERQGMEATIRNLRQRPQRPLPGLWDKNDFAAKKAWEAIKVLSRRDRDQINALATRQSALAATIAADQMLSLDALATAPFTTGLGNEHPLENGFAFLNPYGLPYLPGSGVKGVLRQAARELAGGEWGEPHGWEEGFNYEITIDRKPVRLSMLDVLFGRESGDGDTEHVRGALTFWDVIPQIKGDSLMVEIMTPHQSHYYQQNPAAGSTNPHDSGQLDPISYLTVPPGSGFAFHVVCDSAHLARLAPALLADDNGKPHWQTLMTAAFEHAFQWLGFGAKTAVGYGAMESEAMRRTRKQKAEAVPWQGARLKFNRANKALTAEKDGKSAVAIAPKGEELLATLPAEIRKKVETNQFVKATAYVAGTTLIRIET
jgi:CRISPR-associated protein Cmr6